MKNKRIYLGTDINATGPTHIIDPKTTFGQVSVEVSGLGDNLPTVILQSKVRASDDTDVDSGWINAAVFSNIDNNTTVAANIGMLPYHRVVIISNLDEKVIQVNVGYN